MANGLFQHSLKISGLVWDLSGAHSDHLITFEDFTTIALEFHRSTFGILENC